ncbi:MAG: uroporphyrinogen-III C-methyltransferase [Bacteroidota bacterium]
MMPENEKTPSPAPLNVASTGRKPSRQQLCLAIAVAALLLSGGQWLVGRQQFADLQQELTQRQAGDQAAHAAQKELRDEVEALQSKLGAVDGRLSEFQSQNAAQQSLYQDLARSREEATLLEVEQAVTLAAQQLQLAGNVPVAILALQTADARLARLDRPVYLPLRKAVGKDLGRLNALPFVDVPGISLRLEQLVIGADKWPLASLGRPVAKAEGAPQAKALPWWQRTADVVWQELKGLVRIQRFDRDDAALLAPGQSFFLRENVKLRLLNARLALLSHDQATFRGELKAAGDWLSRHFDGDDKAVQAAQATLRQMAGAELNLELPNLNETQAALRALRDGKDKR